MLAGSHAGIPVADTGSVRTDLASFARALAWYLATPTGRAIARAASLSSDDAGLAEAWQIFKHRRPGARAGTARCPQTGPPQPVERLPIPVDG
ncbi:TetR/AcrR family transcriptional regulator C-terminal ligand-binding domain-containing protein [Streptomyces sp. NPDC056224]|uniref:TetR/AcrR family transcriptional regulator C-terminal ligand-binding domain-containing protein n=1 Tax=Streptomyces sp. NPDC056224 TaxID=3345750 RepID=UPI0035E2E74B